MRFETYGREGLFAAEPDFPTALDLYRETLPAAQAQRDPPFDPPDSIQPEFGCSPETRRELWRTQRFPELQVAWWWLAEFFLRVTEGLPPVTEVEFAELATWFGEHESRLTRLEGSRNLLELSGGRHVSSSTVRYDLWRGPRVCGAGEAAEQIRQLRARYGGRLS